jgi:hypothetical protein
MSVVEEGYFITDIDVVTGTLLGILKGNRDCYKSSEKQKLFASQL